MNSLTGIFQKFSSGSLNFGKISKTFQSMLLCFDLGQRLMIVRNYSLLISSIKCMKPIVNSQIYAIFRIIVSEFSKKLNSWNLFSVS